MTSPTTLRTSLLLTVLAILSCGQAIALGQEFPRVTWETFSGRGGSAWESPAGLIGSGLPDEVLMQRLDTLKPQQLQNIDQGLTAMTEALVSQYASAADDVRRDQVGAELSFVVGQHFAVRQAIRDRELDELEEEVARLRQRLQQREEAKQQIVEGRIDELLRSASGLAWDNGATRPSRDASPVVEATTDTEKSPQIDGGVANAFSKSGILGKWEVLRTHQGGELVPNTYLYYDFQEAGRLIITRPFGSTEEGTYAIDTAPSPKHIAIEMMSDRPELGGGGPRKGIFAFTEDGRITEEGDELHMAINAGAFPNRPSTLAVTPSEQIIYIRMKREFASGSTPAAQDASAPPEAPSPPAHGDIAASVNLIQNPTIEEGDDSPAHWETGNSIPGVEYSWKKQSGPNGTGCLCITKTAERYFPIAAWRQEIRRTGDAPAVQISAQVKASDAHKAILDVSFLGADGKWISHEWAAFIGSKQEDEPPANHDWKQYSGTVKIPPGTATIVIGLQDYGPGTVCFANVNASYALQ